MKYDKAIVDFLSQKENFICALEISERIKDARKKVHDDFWKAVIEKLKVKMQGYHDWELKYDDKLFKDVYGESYIYIEPNNKQQKDFYLYPYLGIESNSIYYGIASSKSSSKKYSLKEVNKLKEKLENEKHKFNEDYSYAEYDNYDNHFFQKIVENKDELTETISNLLWETFKNNLQLLERANRAISKAIRDGKKYP